ncbi:cytochrome P450 [Mollisia scopiformis]|uniref:Cytochrome P450 n=1 Tax=Mollisia scopiformis TaxID=149040 RepID=A0A132BBA6_MOLSC|nr:cytochrome P450 [Mollisia scopiformis]KUJ09553.1 cytochrome P450 [Mollisia scopiformis]
MLLFQTLFRTWLALVAFYIGWTCLALLRNIRIAKATGLKYVVVPWFSYNALVSLFMRRVFLQLLNKVLPQSSEASVTSWRSLVTGIWPLRFRHAPFAAFGTDTFLAVSPGGIILNTADADVVSQIAGRGDDFPKPIGIYRAVSIYGMNVVTSEGEEWRHHRRLTSPAFCESNNQLVWRETIDRTQAMLVLLLGRYTSSKTVQHLADDVMRLSLEIIGNAALGQKILWPTIEDGEEPETQHLKAGHTMTFSASLGYITTNMIFMATALTTFPLWLIKRIPSARVKKLYEAYDNWKRYMQDMIAERKLGLHSENGSPQNIDLIGQLVKGQVKNKASARGGVTQPGLTDTEVLGNLFVFIVAGHETSASSLYMTILLLALHPHVQKHLQEVLEHILQGRPPSEWDYEQDLPPLMNSFLTAVWNEELRLVSPVLSIPKVVASSPQEVLINGRYTILPPDMTIRLCVSAVHVNPKYWSHGPPSDPANPIFCHDNLDNDMEEFNPHRWMRPEASPLPTPEWDSFKDGSMPNTPTSGTSSTQRYNRLRFPTKGSFIPFSEGQRSCLGKRFAQIEILTALAVIFSQYSVELAVDDWANDEEVKNMTRVQRQETWNKAAKRARYNWQNKLTCAITVQMASSGHVPLRFVLKGQERFFDLD